MFFHRTPNFIQYLYPSLTWSIKTKAKTIFLTFDDGPIPNITEFVLDTLGDFNVKATFFCVGENLSKHQNIAQRALDEGHQLANHTHHHLNGWQASTDAYLKDFKECERQLDEFNQSRLFRPPYGRIKKSQINKIKNTHKIIMWNVLTGDYNSKIHPRECLYNSIKATRSGSIILFHDNIKAKKNLMYTLPRYIEHFKNKEYHFALI